MAKTEPRQEGQGTPSTAMDAAAPYSGAWQHLSDELRLLDLRLGMFVGEQRRNRSSGPLDSFKGLVISEEEVTDLLRELVGDRPTPGDDPNREAWMASLRRLDELVQASLAASAMSGVYLPLPLSSGSSG